MLKTKPVLLCFVSFFFSAAFYFPGSFFNFFILFLSHAQKRTFNGLHEPRFYSYGPCSLDTLFSADQAALGSEQPGLVNGSLFYKTQPPALVLSANFLCCRFLPLLEAHFLSLECVIYPVSWRSWGSSSTAGLDPPGQEDREMRQTCACLYLRPPFS